MPNFRCGAGTSRASLISFNTPKNVDTMYYSKVFLFVFIAFLVAAHADQITLSGIIRDVWPCAQQSSCGVNASPQVTCDSSQCAVDFERYIGDDRGIPQTIISTDRKPVFNSSTSHPSINSQSQFANWYRDATGYNIPITLNMTLDNNQACVQAGISCQPSTYGYVNYDFFPIDNMGFGNYYNGHNFHFTFELHTRFTYQGGEVFKFTGDDDVWVFINDRLAVDIGGVHSQESVTLYLDNLGLTKGANYGFDLFYNERHTTASDLALFTSIQLYCSFTDWCGVCQGNGQSCCKCNDNNLCTTDKCNATTGACIFTPISCPNADYCNLGTCNSANGQCTTTPANCDDGNACTADSCDPNVGCQHIAKDCDDGYSCTQDSCDTSSGQCSHVSLDCTKCSGPGAPTCTTTDLCNPVQCDPTSGTCQTYPVNCDDGNACTTDSCSVQAGSAVCSHTAIVCDDSDLCTNDTCSASTGCVFTNVTCDDSNACTIDTCSQGECIYTSVQIPTTDKCHSAYCDTLMGIQIDDVVCRPSDSCHCNPHHGCQCGLSTAETAAIVSTGGIVGIAIAAAAFVAFAGFGGKKGYDLWVSHANKMQGANENPLYTDAGRSGNNPLYDRSSTDVI